MSQCCVGRCVCGVKVLWYSVRERQGAGEDVCGAGVPLANWEPALMVHKRAVIQVKHPETVSFFRASRC